MIRINRIQRNLGVQPYRFQELEEIGYYNEQAEDEARQRVWEDEDDDRPVIYSEEEANLNVAARNVAQEIRLCRELGGVKQAVEKAWHQLSTIESLIQNQNNGLQPHVNVNNGYGLTVDSYAKLAMAREAMVKMLDKVRG